MPNPGYSGSTVPRRRLGRELERIRKDLGWTRKAAAAKLEMNDNKLWRLETGQVSSQPIVIRSICNVYGVDQRRADALVALSRLTKAKGWWHSYGEVLPDWFEVYIDLESAATELSLYDSLPVPGIMQTQRYAEALYRGPGSVATDETEVARRVQLRLGRQVLLTRTESPLRLHAYLSEAMLRSVIGGPAVMAEQLIHISKLGDLPNVTVRVVPLDAGMHGGIALGSGVHLLRFSEPYDPDTVYVQAPTGGLYLDQPTEIQQYEVLFDDLAERALGERESRDLIARTAEEYARE